MQGSKCQNNVRKGLFCLSELSHLLAGGEAKHGFLLSVQMNLDSGREPPVFGEGHLQAVGERLLGAVGLAILEDVFATNHGHRVHLVKVEQLELLPDALELLVDPIRVSTFVDEDGQ